MTAEESIALLKKIYVDGTEGKSCEPADAVWLCELYHTTVTAVHKVTGENKALIKENIALGETLKKQEFQLVALRVAVVKLETLMIELAKMKWFWPRGKLNKTLAECQAVKAYLVAGEIIRPQEPQASQA